jgi:hypothetical protein
LLSLRLPRSPRNHSERMDSMPNPAFTIRELEERDLPELARIMAEGFPRHSRAFWENCLRLIKQRDRAPGTPQYGYGIEADGLKGAALALGSLHGPPDSPQTIVNISSWTVRPLEPPAVRSACPRSSIPSVASLQPSIHASAIEARMFPRLSNTGEPKRTRLATFS